MTGFKGKGATPIDPLRMVDDTRALDAIDREVADIAVGFAADPCDARRDRSFDC